MNIVDSSNIRKSKKDIDKLPSRAEDSYLTSQTTQYCMSRTLNFLNNTMKITDTKYAALILNSNTAFCTDLFWIHEAYQYLYDHRTNNLSEEGILFGTDSANDNSFITHGMMWVIVELIQMNITTVV